MNDVFYPRPHPLCLANSTEFAQQRGWGFISLFIRFHLPRVIFPKTRTLVLFNNTLGYLNHCS